MRIYPAIDLRGGKCVRLVQGKFDNMTVYSDHPAQMAKKWEEAGAEFIHVVDLDGAQAGKSINFEVIGEICREVKVPVQLGGGIRSMQNIEDMLNNGVYRVILGTIAVKNPQLVKEAVEKYGERIVIGIDASEGKVAVAGWEEVSDLTAVDFARQMEAVGVKTIVYTDIATDGMLTGPNFDAMDEMVKAVKMDVIASGGVSSLEDILALPKTGVEGVIVGKALYTDRVDLAVAVKAVKEEANAR